MSFSYSSLSYQEKIAPPPAPTFILAIVCVFLLLAAMYESWRLPWAVLLGSPLVALGALFGVWLLGYDNNVYVQIGLVMLIGLATAGCSRPTIFSLIEIASFSANVASS